MKDVITMTSELISRQSVTPDDAGCQTLIADHLDALGFVIEDLPFGSVSNLWARRGNTGPVFCFAGHTDVVPPGPLTDWQSPPFEPVVRDGQLYGRGAADMKGGLAAMLVATEKFVLNNPNHAGSIAFLITSDEEGIATDGTRRVMQHLTEQGVTIEHCVVGEPSSAIRLGDTVRIGRRGSLHGHLQIHGIQGHVAYPDKANNPIHRIGPVLTAFCTEKWDDGNAYFPPTTMQISNLHAGTGADNVIPGVLDAQFNFRFATSITVEQIQQRVHAIFDQSSLDYEIDWRVSGEPFLSTGGKLTDAIKKAIKDQTGLSTELSTGGGTSDGRFIAPTGTEVIELGPVNASIHKTNEHVSVDDLQKLVLIYQNVLQQVLS